MSLQSPAADAAGFEIGFKVADVDAVFAELVAHGAVHVAAPTDRPRGATDSLRTDPDGYLVEFAQDLGRSSGLPAGVAESIRRGHAALSPSRTADHGLIRICEVASDNTRKSR